MQISLPTKPKIIKKEGNKATFEIEGCYPGYGMTLGNAFRRALLSSLPGAAITAVKIKGVQHEFSTIPNVLEDIIQIILNLKQIRFRLFSDQLTKASLRVKGEKEVRAGDIKTTADLEVVNPEAHIATLTNKKAELEMEIDVEPGLGYEPVERRKKEKQEIGKITLDAIFTPIRRANYEIEPMRVGDRTDYNRIRFNIETDGSISPEEAFTKAAQILVDHFKLLTKLEVKEIKKKKPIVKAVRKIKKPQVKKEEVNKIKIENLKLSHRTINALTEDGLKTVGGLIRKKEEDLMKIEGLGKKGIKEIRKALGQFGLTLKQ